MGANRVVHSAVLPQLPHAAGRGYGLRPRPGVERSRPPPRSAAPKPAGKRCMAAIEQRQAGQPFASHQPFAASSPAHARRRAARPFAPSRSRRQRPTRLAYGRRRASSHVGRSDPAKAVEAHRPPSSDHYGSPCEASGLFRRASRSAKGVEPLASLGLFSPLAQAGVQARSFSANAPWSLAVAGGPPIAVLRLRALSSGPCPPKAAGGFSHGHLDPAWHGRAPRSGEGHRGRSLCFPTPRAQHIQEDECMNLSSRPLAQPTLFMLSTPSPGFCLY
jgi:hypothetical protein